MSNEPDYYLLLGGIASHLQKREVDPNVIAELVDACVTYGADGGHAYEVMRALGMKAQEPDQSAPDAVGRKGLPPSPAAISSEAPGHMPEMPEMPRLPDHDRGECVWRECREHPLDPTDRFDPRNDPEEETP